MSRAWGALRSWKQKLATNNRLPITMESMTALFVMCINVGFESSKDALYWFSVAVLFRVACFALLRPGEELKLRFAEIYFQSALQGLIAVIRIEDPKNRWALGNTQFAIIRDSVTIAWLQWFCAASPSLLKLWPSTRDKLCSCLQTAFNRIGLGLIGFTLGGFRAGGATDAVMAISKWPGSNTWAGGRVNLQWLATFRKLWPLWC